MIGFNGGLIGKVRTPSIQNATGVWTSNEQINAKRSAIWPSTGFAIVTSGLVQYLDAGRTESYPGTGATWTDLSGNGYNATLVNGFSYSNDNAGVIEFNGTNGHATSTLPALTNFSISAWVRWLSSQAGERQLFNTFNDQFGASINSSKFFVFNGSSITGAQTVAINTWYHWVVTSTSGTTRIVINTNQDASGASHRSITSGATMIANASGQTRFLHARIGSFAVYNKVLSDAEILQNYDADKVRFGL